VQAFTAVEILKAAAKLDGGLTRANVMNAAWNIDIEPPLLFGPIKLDGTKDAYGVETLEFLQYSATTHAMKRTGIKFDQQGKTGVYKP
jgi:hypothetical protein